MGQPAAYWDSSALIPLCITQPQSANAVQMYRSFAILTWWASQVEIISGLTRLLRMGQLSNNEFVNGKQLASSLIRKWNAAGFSPSAAPAACALLELHPLRAADALQLAVALEVCDRQPHGFSFITADRRLADAAGKTGFAVEYLT
jgi:predicted nucleic acid-binding protein